MPAREDHGLRQEVEADGARKVLFCLLVVVFFFVVAAAVLLASAAALAAGDIVGFVTQRTNLDYFHVGFVAYGGKGELLLRHASQTRRRVLDERLDRFMTKYRVRYVTLLRPQEPVSDKKAG